MGGEKNKTQGLVIVDTGDGKPPDLHLVVTGRHAPVERVEYADLVTEMRAVKHPFREQGIRGQAGIEY
jgi:cob(I)alamin adenosyltransferase